ncbi:cytochrome b/b6 domain-containing protein [soil metagenome]
MKRIKNKHPLAVRWFHWINFPVLGVMIWSGLLIYWANDVYDIGWGDQTILILFPDSFYKALNVPFHLADGMAFHFVFMWIFAINGLLYVLYTAFSGEWKYLLPNKKSFKEAKQVLLHDLHLSKFKPPQLRYNGAQKIAYSLIIIMGFGSLVTGIVIYKPIQFGGIAFLLGGYEWARIEHFILTIGYVLFFVIHIAQVVRAGWKNFSAMVTGFEVENISGIENSLVPEKSYVAIKVRGTDTTIHEDIIIEDPKANKAVGLDENNPNLDQS